MRSLPSTALWPHRVCVCEQCVDEQQAGAEDQGNLGAAHVLVARSMQGVDPIGHTGCC